MDGLNVQSGITGCKRRLFFVVFENACLQRRMLASFLITKMSRTKFEKVYIDSHLCGGQGLSLNSKFVGVCESLQL